MRMRDMLVIGIGIGRTVYVSMGTIERNLSVLEMIFTNLINLPLQPP